MNAAIIYQHATREVDRVIADALGSRMQALLESARTPAQDTHEVEDHGLEVTELFELKGFVLGSLRVSRSRAAWGGLWIPAVVARQWHGAGLRESPG